MFLARNAKTFSQIKQSTQKSNLFLQVFLRNLAFLLYFINLFLVKLNNLPYQAKFSGLV